MPLPLVKTGTFTAAGASPTTIRPLPSADGLTRFNVTLVGTFVATVALERLLPGETTWAPVASDSYGGTTSMSAPVSFMVMDPEAGVIYRLNCTSWTSGTVNWRMSQ